mgnify:CR=1 FL=1
MGELIKLDDRKKAPHLAGEALCLACKHTWAAVAPVGVFELECPACGSGKGIFKKPVSYTDLPHWACNCGNQYFVMTPTFVYCSNCGEKQHGF